MESIESFRLRARAWLAENMPRLSDNEAPKDNGDGLAPWLRARELQKRLWDGGFAGICFPVEYGGLGLTPAHQRAFTEASATYEMPLLLNVPTFSIVLPTLLDFGTEEQKRQHIRAALRGDEVMVQLLSEPRGGSDLAGIITRATRDGDLWILNGAKVWSSGAYAADYGVCLARTDWDATKHRGLTVFLVKVHQPGIEIRRIRQVDGDDEFCEEFFDDVELPAESVIGEVNAGWAVASRLLFHERTAVGGGSPYVSGAGERTGRRTGSTSDLVQLAQATGQSTNAHVRELVAEAHVLRQVQQQLIDRVTTGISTNRMPAPAASVMRLLSAEVGERISDIGLEVAGSHAVAGGLGEPGPGEYGHHFLSRQGGSLGGGSSEMSRNIISERLLGMPREYAADRDVPFNQVRQGRS